MPGVPSGRACEGCHRQKKKCDQARPSCSRCTRLQMICIGSGQRRYKFKEQHGFGVSLTKGQVAKKLTRRESFIDEKAVPSTPSNELTLMANAFIETISKSTDLRFNLAWTYGFFLDDVPRRLGTNEALDASVMALVDAHSNFCSYRGVTTSVLIKYSRALNKLRVCLDDPIKACASETLCAVMLLLICQGFIGINKGRFTGHCEGAAQILKARRYFNAQDDFECKLVLTLRGPVVFEALFNPKIQFSPREWKTLVENPLNADTTWGIQVMHCLSRLPPYMHRARAVLRGDGEDPKLLDEINTDYKALKAVLGELHGRLAAVEKRMVDGTPLLDPVVQAHSILQRIYGLCLTFGIIFGCVLSALDICNTEIYLESAYFSKEVLALAELATRYRPLGTSCIPLYLVAAWVATTDCSIRSSVEKVLAEYQWDYVRGREATTTISELEQICRHMRLLDLYPCEEEPRD
ncbi:hypothetical protein K469DRAFT_726837 [Zopfia rhizophila CBS 207.26]|uniref:Zn(2)-C6 fungal-type domain-containing protein n=1 Tax=Zopfia rhizophila CBS 207.26 TaxID=1314779 RepID=A0A6A6E462_9PEZI|nr:hypothetical protein K469DRAFT_726837 [Zopfia rhizophila CBS 207.26]